MCFVPFLPRTEILAIRGEGVATTANDGIGIDAQPPGACPHNQSPRSAGHGEPTGRALCELTKYFKSRAPETLIKYDGVATQQMQPAPIQAA